MVAFNMLWKLCVVVAFGLSVTATDVSQEEPKKESLVSGFSGTEDEHGTEPPKFSLEWYLLPKPENRAALRYVLPRSLAKDVPEDYNKPIDPALGKVIRKYFLWYGFEWYLLAMPESRAALRYVLPKDLADMVPENFNKPIAPLVENDIRKHFLWYAVEWYLLPKPENRSDLRYLLPKNLAKDVPEDFNVPITPKLEKDIRKYLSLIRKKQK
ncbi:SmORF protein [Babesia bovis T2Bo]|uniref:SmORF n=1 Tax=Babesia bovis TaxID=5865 RepID=A7ATW6_BABBO|nr:SmORF protein [Babesia bovis T2Bo]EDO06377.1 SmORF protein [Babesia bovis T2Bo]|eukprot:XP_001609945.1 SmORF [Babesia bovis]